MMTVSKECVSLARIRAAQDGLRAGARHCMREDWSELRQGALARRWAALEDMAAACRHDGLAMDASLLSRLESELSAARLGEAAVMTHARQLSLAPHMTELNTSVYRARQRSLERQIAFVRANMRASTRPAATATTTTKSPISKREDVSTWADVEEDE